MSYKFNRWLLGVGVAVLFLFTFECAAYSQVSLDGPSLGFLYETRARSITPVLGLPGAGRFGAPSLLSSRLTHAVASAAGNYLLGSNEDGRLMLVDPDHASSIEILSDEVDARDATITLSPLGSSALLYFRSEQRIAVISGLPNAPAVAWQVGLDGVPSAPSHAAISDDGRVILLGSRETSGVFAITSSEGARQIDDRLALSIAFAPRSHNAVFAATADRKIVVLNDVAGNLRTQDLAGEEVGIIQPTEVAFSGDGSRVFVQNAGSSDILLINVSDGRISSLSCSCVPTGFHRLRGDSVFRLNEPLAGVPLWVLDADAIEPRLVFIPAAVKQ